MPDTILIEPVQYHTTEDIEAMLESIESQLVKLNQGNQRSRDMAQRMFQAILENPLQHAPQASCHAKAIIDRHTGGCRLTASDTGPGIRATLSRNPGLTVPGHRPRGNNPWPPGRTYPPWHAPGPARACTS